MMVLVGAAAGVVVGLGTSLFLLLLKNWLGERYVAQVRRETR